MSGFAAKDHLAATFKNVELAINLMSYVVSINAKHVCAEWV